MTDDHGDHQPPTLPSCPDCGTEATPGGRFCRACGAPLEATDPGGGRPIDAPTPGAGGLVAGRPGTVDDDETTGELPRATGRLAATEPATSMRTCHNCGAPNSSRRELCGRCGADLDTGELTVRPDRTFTPPTGFAVEEDRARRWLVPLVAVLGVLAAVVVGLALAGVGPFDRAPVLADIAFDEARYGDDAVRLAVVEIATLSTLPDQGGESYAATQMVDDDTTTAWNSDGGGDGPEQGIGERIDIELDGPAWIERLVIANGDQRDPDTYAANARVKRAQLTLDGGITFVLNLLDEGLGEQAVELRNPALTTSLRLEVLDVFPGDTHRDLAISDLALEGWPAEGEDAAVAQQRRDARPAIGVG